MHPTLTAIVGPTASGKTDYALRLARERGGELISVDSRQVYRFLSIGTAKPNPATDIPYQLIDIWDPAEPFTAADFVRLASEKIAEIRARQKEPILVGGTGLYFKALQEGLATLPPADPELREELRSVANAKGRAFLHAELTRVDPEAALKIPANNIQRVVRAVEVFRLTGKPISVWHKEHQAKPHAFTLHAMGNALPLDDLHRRITERCHWMLDHGMIEETQRLLEKGYAPNCPALTGLGYPRVIAYLRGELTRPKLLELLTQDTRQYAKRQRTWFRHQMDVTWKTF